VTSESSTEGIILPYLINYCCAKNELEGRTANEVPMNILFDVKEKWRTKFKEPQFIEEQLPNEEVKGNEEQVKNEKENAFIDVLNKTSTEGVILPSLIYRTVSNELEGRSFGSETHEFLSLEEEVKWKERNKPIMLQFFVEQLPYEREQMQLYLSIEEVINSLFSNIFRLFRFLFDMSFPRTQGSFFLILFLLLLKLVFYDNNPMLVKYTYIQQFKQIDAGEG
jgi:hypothetical protein